MLHEKCDLSKAFFFVFVCLVYFGEFNKRAEIEIDTDIHRLIDKSKYRYGQTNEDFIDTQADTQLDIHIQRQPCTQTGMLE